MGGVHIISHTGRLLLVIIPCPPRSLSLLLRTHSLSTIRDSGIIGAQPHNGQGDLLLGQHVQNLRQRQGRGFGVEAAKTPVDNVGL